MTLLTKQVEANLPALYSQEGISDPLVRIKFFAPGQSASWYILEGSPIDETGCQIITEGGKHVSYDPDAHPDFLFFGYVTGLGCDELGYVALSDLESLKMGTSGYIERDRHFKPVLLSVIRAGDAAANNRCGCGKPREDDSRYCTDCEEVSAAYGKT